MTAHAAGRHGANFAGTRHRTAPAHARVAGQPRWWRTERGRALAARRAGDILDELQQLAAVAIVALVVLGGTALVAAALWPTHPHIAVTVAATAVLAVSVWLVLGLRRPR